MSKTHTYTIFAGIITVFGLSLWYLSLPKQQITWTEDINITPPAHAIVQDAYRPCKNTEGFCEITNERKIFDVLEVDLARFRWETDCGPLLAKKIYLQTTHEVYNNNQITDIQNVVLSSTKHTCDELSGSITVYIGVAAPYLNTLAPEEKETIYRKALIQELDSMIPGSTHNQDSLAKKAMLLEKWHIPHE
jgi:hypothetical protein